MDDIMRALLAVQRGHVLKFKLLNTAFITLLPKKVHAACCPCQGLQANKSHS
jgi:hypothetical protein